MAIAKLLAVLSLMPLIVEADEIQLNTFQNGQVADADDVNENFNNLKTAIENTNGAALTCDSGFKSYVDGRLCMSESFGPADMKTAKNVCGSLASGSRVCKEADFYQACGSWLNGDADEDLNPFLGVSQEGWLGDVTYSGNGSSHYFIRKEKDCSRITQYQLIPYQNAIWDISYSFQYQCCY